MELRDLEDKYKAIEIRNQIVSSFLSTQVPTALFVILGRNIEYPPNSEFTHNWVNFEVGVAAKSLLPVWVFEREGEFIRFPIPYVTDYLTYVLDGDGEGRRIREIFVRRFTGGIRKRTDEMKCSFCKATYNYFNNSSTINCPVCRTNAPVTKNP